MPYIVNKIERVLESKRLTKTELAQKIGVHRDTVYNWTDDNIKVSVLLKISDYLNVPVQDFLYEKSKTTSTVTEPAPKYGKLRDECADVREMNSILKSQLDHYKTMVDALHTVIEAFEAMQRHTVEKNTAHAKPTHKK
jgi:DNA-binding Xre family transcriptional regulator